MNRVTTLHMPQFLPSEERKMAGIRRSTLPVVSFGRQSTTPSCTITENAQLRMNRLAFEALGKPAKVLLDCAEDRMFKIVNWDGKPVPKGWVEADLYDVQRGKEKAGRAPDHGAYLTSMTGVWKSIGYDVVASGTQIFTPVASDGKAGKQLAFGPLPKGALPKRAVAPRKPRKAKVAAAGATNSAASADVDLGL